MRSDKRNCEREFAAADENTHESAALHAQVSQDSNRALYNGSSIDVKRSRAECLAETLSYWRSREGTIMASCEADVNRSFTLIMTEPVKVISATF